MTSPMVRRCLAAFVAIGLVTLAACSGGSNTDDRVSVGPRTTTSSSAGSAHTSSTKGASHSSKSKSKSGKKRTAGTTKGSSSRSSSTSGETVTVTTSGALYVGDTTPTSPGDTPTTSGAPAHHTTTTLPRTTTTVEGPQPYDPSKPINLCCEAGVTLAEQHRAEQLVRDTLRDLPKYADYNVAYNDGYRSIGDGFTGYEHYVKWSLLNDGHILDSQLPESLVYDTSYSPKKLVSAMYSLPLGSTFADVPDVGGPLTQWHVHDDLCLTDDPNDPLRKVVSSLTTVNGTCPPGSSKAGSAPMLHVWIVKNACGPFAPLEGIGGGQVPPGQTPLCDKGHGSVGT